MGDGNCLLFSTSAQIIGTNGYPGATCFKKSEPSFFIKGLGGCSTPGAKFPTPAKRTTGLRGGMPQPVRLLVRRLRLLRRLELRWQLPALQHLGPDQRDERLPGCYMLREAVLQVGGPSS